MILELVVIPLLVNLVLGTALLLRSKKSQHIFMWEYMDLISPVCIFAFLTDMSTNGNSQINLVEVYLTVIVTLTYCFLKLELGKVPLYFKAAGSLLIAAFPFAVKLLNG